jgi:hypothetical protein
MVTLHTMVSLQTNPIKLALLKNDRRDVLCNIKVAMRKSTAGKIAELDSKNTVPRVLSYMVMSNAKLKEIFALQKFGTRPLEGIPDIRGKFAQLAKQACLVASKA